MTIKESIEILIMLKVAWAQLDGTPDELKAASWAVKALDAAISALRGPTREQVGRIKGEWKWFDEEVTAPFEYQEREWGWRCSKCGVVLPDDFDNPDYTPTVRFCENCGSPMTDEAVQMVLERLEALHENRD